MNGGLCLTNIRTRPSPCDKAEQNQTDETTPRELASKFVLSLSQAKAWLKKEPKYPTNLTDESLHEQPNRPRF